MGHTGGVKSVCWSPEGDRIATASDDKMARIWDARTETEALKLKGQIDNVWLVCWSPDQNRIATSSTGGPARIWDARTGAEALTLKGQSSPVMSVSLEPRRGPDRHRELWTVTARIWDAKTGAEALTLKGHNSPRDVGVAGAPAGTGSPPRALTVRRGSGTRRPGPRPSPSRITPV